MDVKLVMNFKILTKILKFFSHCRELNDENCVFFETAGEMQSSFALLMMLGNSKNIFHFVFSAKKKIFEK